MYDTYHILSHVILCNLVCICMHVLSAGGRKTLGSHPATTCHPSHGLSATKPSDRCGTFSDIAFGGQKMVHKTQS